MIINTWQEDKVDTILATVGDGFNYLAVATIWSASVIWVSG